MDNNLGNKKVFAENLRMYMEKNGYNSKDIAERLDVKQSTVSYWINARYYPRIDKIEKLANLFHVNKSCLVEEPDFHLKLKEEFLEDLKLTPKEKSIILAWRKADERDKDVIERILSAYEEKGTSSESSFTSKVG